MGMTPPTSQNCSEDGRWCTWKRQGQCLACQLHLMSSNHGFSVPLCTSPRSALFLPLAGFLCGCLPPTQAIYDVIQPWCFPFFLRSSAVRDHSGWWPSVQAAAPSLQMATPKCVPGNHNQCLWAFLKRIKTQNGILGSYLFAKCLETQSAHQRIKGILQQINSFSSAYCHSPTLCDLVAAY